MDTLKEGGGSKIQLQNLLMIIGAVLTFIIILVLYLYLRDSPKNNFRRAQKYHKRAERYYNEGETELAEQNYDLSRKYREKAEAQLKGEF